MSFVRTAILPFRFPKQPFLAFLKLFARNRDYPSEMNGWAARPLLNGQENNAF